MLDYFNSNLKLNEKIFDKKDFFDTIYNFLCSCKYTIGDIDDFKGNISYRELEPFSNDVPGEFYIQCRFSWISYLENEKDFVKIANNIEHLFNTEFKTVEEVNCFRYTGTSEYSDHGFDVVLDISFSYELKI